MPRLTAISSRSLSNIGIKGLSVTAGNAFAIFSFGAFYHWTNLVSNTGVVATDVTGVGTSRSNVAAAGYGGDKAIFGYGTSNADFVTDLSMTNRVSNTGVVATDTTGVGTARTSLAAAGYGTDKAIFGYGSASNTATTATNLVSNTGVVANDVFASGTARLVLAAAGFGGDKAIFGYGAPAGGAPPYLSITSLVSNTGAVVSEVTGVGTARRYLAAAGYGTDKAIFGYGQNSANSSVSITNLVSNTGVVVADVTSVGTVRHNLAAAGYGTDKAIFGYGLGGGNFVSMTNLVSNTGTVVSEVTGVGTARAGLAGASYG